jgi:hypothetical protein
MVMLCVAAFAKAQNSSQIIGSYSTSPERIIIIITTRELGMASGISNDEPWNHPSPSVTEGTTVEVQQ